MVCPQQIVTFEIDFVADTIVRGDDKCLAQSSVLNRVGFATGIWTGWDYELYLAQQIEGILSGF